MTLAFILGYWSKKKLNMNAVFPNPIVVPSSPSDFFPFFEDDEIKCTFCSICSPTTVPS